jgi:pimeloyl-ACP methyl ester carboxylesterase
MSTEPTELFVDVRGTAVRLLRAGSGPPLLYLHGSTDGAWLPAHAALAEAHTVLRPDLPGFGGSADDERIDSVHDLAFFCLDLLETLEIEHVALVGSSLGGWLAADLATIEPRRITRLVLIDAAGLRVEDCGQPDEFVLDTAQVVERAFHAPEQRERAMTAATAVEGDPALLETHLRNRIATAHLAWNPYFHDPKLPDRLHRITAPTLIVWGREDGLVPLAHAHRWDELLPDARLEVIEDCGHVPHVEALPRFLELVAPFLGAAPGGD